MGKILRPKNRKSRFSASSGRIRKVGLRKVPARHGTRCILHHPLLKVVHFSVEGMRLGESHLKANSSQLVSFASSCHMYGTPSAASTDEAAMIAAIRNLGHRAAKSNSSSSDDDSTLAAMLTSVVNRVNSKTQETAARSDASLKSFSQDLQVFRGNMENYVTEQVTRATSEVQDLRQEFTAQAGQVAEKLSSVDDDLSRVQAQIGAKFELVMQQTVALRLENESLSARLAAFESQHHPQLLAGDTSRSSTPDHSLPVSPSVARICNGAPEDDDLVSGITNVQPTPHDDAHIAGTGPRWVDNSGKSHCDPPVNFPISFLTSYSPDGFPQREFDFYCAGHLTAEPPNVPNCLYRPQAYANHSSGAYHAFEDCGDHVEIPRLVLFVDLYDIVTILVVSESILT